MASLLRELRRWPPKLSSTTPTNEAIHQSYLQRRWPMKLSSTTPPNEAIINETAHRKYHRQHHRLPMLLSNATVHQSYHRRYSLLQLSLTKPLTEAIIEDVAHRSYHWRCCSIQLSSMTPSEVGHGWGGWMGGLKLTIFCAVLLILVGCLSHHGLGILTPMMKDDCLPLSSRSLQVPDGLTNYSGSHYQNSSGPWYLSTTFVNCIFWHLGKNGGLC